MLEIGEFDFWNFTSQRKNFNNSIDNKRPLEGFHKGTQEVKGQKWEMKVKHNFIWI